MIPAQKWASFSRTLITCMYFEHIFFWGRGETELAAAPAQKTSLFHNIWVTKSTPLAPQAVYMMLTTRFNKSLWCRCVCLFGVCVLESTRLCRLCFVFVFFAFTSNMSPLKMNRWKYSLSFFSCVESTHIYFNILTFFCFSSADVNISTVDVLVPKKKPPFFFIWLTNQSQLPRFHLLNSPGGNTRI